mgnify:CR=1 FL=1
MEILAGLGSAWTCFCFAGLVRGEVCLSPALSPREREWGGQSASRQQVDEVKVPHREVGLTGSHCQTPGKSKDQRMPSRKTTF